MGCSSSKTKHKKHLESTHLNPNSPTPQILFLGLPGAGKTTLMYKTLIPEWCGNTYTNLPETKSFHYEKIQRGKIQLGLWDLAGNEALRGAWRAFYRFVDVWVVVYVINMQDRTMSSLLLNKQCLEELLQDPCLRRCIFVLVFNTMGVSLQDTDNINTGVYTPEKILQLQDKDTHRIYRCIVNCNLGLKDTEWCSAFHLILQNIQTLITPSPPPPQRTRNKQPKQEQKKK